MRRMGDGAYYPGEEPETGEMGLLVSVNEENSDRRDVWEVSQDANSGQTVIGNLASNKTEEEVAEILNLPPNKDLDVKYLDSSISLARCQDKPVQAQMAAQMTGGAPQPS